MFVGLVNYLIHSKLLYIVEQKKTLKFISLQLREYDFVQTNFNFYFVSKNGFKNWFRPENLKSVFDP